MFVEYFMERRSRLEDISKQSGWGNSLPNPTGGKLMHIYLRKLFTIMLCLEKGLGRPKPVDE